MSQPNFNTMSLQEIRERREGLKAEARKLVNQTPDGKWTPAAQARFDGIEGEIAVYDAAIEKYQGALNRAAGDIARTGRSTGPFGSLGEQLQCVAAAAAPGGRPDERLYQVLNAGSGMQEGVGSEGGFLVQEDFSTALLGRVLSAAPLAIRANRIPLSAGASSIVLPAVDESSRANGARWGGVASYWAGEGDEFTPSRPKIRRLKLELKKLVGLCYATEELVADSSALTTVIGQAFEDEFVFKVDDALLRGDGAGKPLGVLNSPCLVTTPKEANQAAGTVIFENIKSMWARMPAKNRGNAVWLINQEVEPQLYSTGPGGRHRGRPRSYLPGRPSLGSAVCYPLRPPGHPHSSRPAPLARWATSCLPTTAST